VTARPCIETTGAEMKKGIKKKIQIFEKI